MRFYVGDIVKLNIDNIQEEGDMREEVMDYILDNPDEEYVVKSTSNKLALAPISLNHHIVGATSFFEDELILVGGDKI